MKNPPMAGFLSGAHNGDGMNLEAARTMAPYKRWMNEPV